MSNDNDCYPNVPGWKVQETSRLAAEAVKDTAPLMRNRVMAFFLDAPDGLTGNELAVAMNYDLAAIRPRVTELVRLGRLRKRLNPDGTDCRRPTPSGCTAMVWEVVPEDQVEAAA